MSRTLHRRKEQSERGYRQIGLFQATQLAVLRTISTSRSSMRVMP